MELSKLQKEILEKSTGRSIILASAASGKTALLTEKVRQVIRSGVEPSKIAVITFTNMAATELRNRLGVDYKDGIFIGTIHSLANYMLRTSGIDTSKILEDAEFDKLFSMIKSNQQCIRQYEWIFLDEAQDSTKTQFDFILDMILPTHYFLVGDLKQSIYGFNNARPDILHKLTKSKNVDVFNLNENYRNASNILSFAKRIISQTGLFDTSICMRKVNGTVTEVPYSISEVARLIQKTFGYKEWAILVRTNDEIKRISNALNKRLIPCTTFKQGDLTKEDLNRLMREDTVKVLTVHSAKGLEWDNVIVIGMYAKTPEDYNVQYVAATRARNNLYWMRYKAKNPHEHKIYRWN